jgi:7-cyano-7-deazaguanine synthase in queuosine biosynthesis
MTRPQRAGIILAEFPQHFVGARRDRLALSHVADVGRGLDLLLLQAGDGVVQLVLLARGDGDRCAHLAQRLGDLQPEPARAPGDERGAPAKLEQLSHVHGGMLIEFSTTMTTLAMFSGGLDSTAMLLQLLEGTDELRVHHIRMANREHRADAEQAAVERIVAWCRARLRPFRYSESALDFTALEAIPIDYLSVAFVACHVAIDTPRCDRIAVAALARDTDIENRSARQRGVFEALYECYRARKLGEPEVRWIYPVYHSTKAELAARLPRELLELTWSCRRPVRESNGRFRPCGACKACLARQGI